MTNRAPILHFAPVPHRRTRGWTPDAQHAFIAALSHCGVVAQAARSVGCTPRSAYQLRQRPGAESFAAAWDQALDMGLDAARARAVALIHGDNKRPLVRRGRVVGHRIAPDFRVMFAALRSLGAERSGLRNAMPHRRRMAARDIIATMPDSQPAEWSHADLEAACRTARATPPIERPSAPPATAPAQSPSLARLLRSARNRK